jgi:Domain of unknown function (DUF4132)
VSWWRSLYLRNALGLQDETLQLVAQYVQCAQSKFPERMMRYAIDGDDEALLAEIVELRQANYRNFWATYSATTGCYELVQLGSEPSHEAGNHLFSDIQALPPLLCYRLAKLNEALGSSSLQPLGWLYQLLARISSQGLIDYFDVTDPITLPTEASFVEQLIQASGETSHTLASLVYLCDPIDYYNARLIAGACAALQGFKDYSLQNVDVIRQALQQKQSSRCQFVLEILICRQIPIEPFLDLVVKKAFSTRKGERELATAYLKQDVSQAVPWIQDKAINGKTTERDRAIHLLWAVQGEAAQEFLVNRLPQEPVEKVQQSIQALLSTLAAAQTTFKPLELPPVLPIKPESPLPDIVKSSMQLILDALQNCSIDTALAIRHLETGTAQECEKYLSHRIKETAQDLVWPNLQTLMGLTDLSFLHAFRLIILLGYFDLRFRRQYLGYRLGPRFFKLLNLYHQAHPEQGLREIAAVLQTLGLDPDQLGRLMFEYHPYFAEEGIWWENEATWPYFYERPHLLINLLNEGQSTSDYFVHRQNAVLILEMFPQPPTALIPLLWTLALGTAKTDRPMAQRCLNRSPHVTERLLDSIQHPDASTRIIAAEWLATRNDTAAIAPLKDLLRREKSDAAKVAFMRSLERLGAPLDEFLNRDQLLSDAQKGLNKGVPAALNEFPFANLPTVHWTDNHQAVEPTILTWLMVQSYKQKSPEPSPLLQQYAQLWHEGDRLALGSFVLNHWIAQDTAPSYTQERAEILARKEAQTYGQFYPNKTQEQIYQELLKNLLAQCRESAIKEKGLLAIAAACITGASAVPVVKKYLDTWYGNRSAQCNALLQMLSWVEDDASIQYLLSIANRFRTKNIQKEADKLIHAIADRHQWTPDELGDRTIPTAGLNADRSLTLNYGSRQFTLTLTAELNLILRNADDKVLKTLPNANQQDNPALAEAAKAAFSQTKKELKQVLQIQKTRLYEAMTVQRSWCYRDWESLLNQHPILSLYTQSLVWAVFEDDRFAHAVRPLGDGTLTTLDDREVTLQPETVLRLAHTSLVSETDAQAWNAHLSDYEVVPPFAQFWTGLYSIPADLQVTDLNDFHNHTLEAFHLRGRATKRGYNRGSTGDGGYFGTYHKTFSSVGIEAVIDFSGNSLPEENIPVQIYGLFFHKPGDRGVREVYDLSDYTKLPLQSVPPVLLQECWNDLRHIVSP